MSETELQYKVNIVREIDGKVVSSMGPMHKSKALRVERGANINLDHANYYTEIVEVVAGE